LGPFGKKALGSPRKGSVRMEKLPPPIMALNPPQNPGFFAPIRLIIRRFRLYHRHITKGTLGRAGKTLDRLRAPEREPIWARQWEMEGKLAKNWTRPWNIIWTATQKPERRVSAPHEKLLNLLRRTRS